MAINSKFVHQLKTNIIRHSRRGMPNYDLVIVNTYSYLFVFWLQWQEVDILHENKCLEGGLDGKFSVF